MQDNLLALQKSAKAIRNPFGTDFKCAWDGQPVVLPGDSKWRVFVGPLADHIAKRLYNLVTNAIHDREVLKLRDAGQDRAARKFSLSGAIKNKVWLAITGNSHPDYNGTEIDLSNREDMDFSVLEKDVKELNRKAEANTELTSVSHIIEQASNEALASLGDAESATVSGSVNMGGPVAERENIPLQTLEQTEPINAATETSAPQPQAVTEDEFAELKTLD